MLLNMFLFIVVILIMVAIATLNVIIINQVLERELTVSEIISENRNTHIGRFFMGSLLIPTFIIMKVKSLPINTQSCVEEEEKEVEVKNPQYQFYSLLEVINLPSKQHIIVGPDNYKLLVKMAANANKHANVDIEIHNENVQEAFLDSFAFYGVKLQVSKYQKEKGAKYIIKCYNANRPD